MGGVLRKAPPSSASAVATKGVFASSSPTNSRVVVPVPSDEQLELEDELQAKREEEAAQKQKAAVAHVVENLFAYAPVTVQTQKYPSSSSKAGQAYLWITVDEAEIKRRGGGASPVRYPVGVAVDINGNVFVSEAGGTPKANANDSQAPYKISADSIMDFAASKRAPPVLKPPRLVEALQIELVVKWKKSTDSTVDRYEVQYRRADSLNNSWAGLAVVTAWKHVSLSGIKCHTPFEFRVRARNPGGWSEYSDQSEVFWTLPGPPDLPRMPIAGAVSNTYASVFWFPVEANGAPPVIYSLEVRESGGGQQSSFLQVYEGTGTGFVVGRLSPKTTYTFRLQASNVVGATAFVESKSCWDPKTEQVFYFNKFTSQRVTEEPPELAVMREERGVITVEETPEMLFRRKRFRFHRELRKSMQGLNFGNTMKIELQRESMFEGTLKYFQPLTKADLVAKPKISFENEPGIDSGLFAVELTSSQLPNFAQQYKFLGKFIAKAIFDRQTLDLPFCDAVYKRLLQQSTGIEDLHQMDSQYHKSLVWMLENDIADVIDETFIVDLKENGKDIPVTDVNKQEYVDLVVQWRTQFGAQAQMDALVQGFTTLALRAFTTELRGMFLKFMTGTNKIPLDGFEPPLNLTNYETLVEKVTFAITNADGFELS
uniref:HECT-type E3 ubiquitin transferase n=1 Tax=Phytophthora ramorum TaxID=164328 RepID=H3HAZ2_PHYRM